MADTPQTYQNHVRWHKPFHFFLVPIMLINFIWSAVEFFMSPGWNEGRWLVVSFALVVLTILVRSNALKAQDRVIRLEEQLRYQLVLPADLAQRTSALAVWQVVALRFASDAELPELVRQTLENRFSKSDEIKRAIKHWRPDTVRV